MTQKAGKILFRKGGRDPISSTPLSQGLFRAMKGTLGYLGTSIRSLQDHPTTVCDCGCGLGDLSLFLKPRLGNSYLVGTDLSLVHLRVARRARYDDVVLCDVQFLPFRSKAFDCVFCLEVIEHFRKSESMEIISKLTGISRQLIVSTPNGFRERHIGDTGVNATDSRCKALGHPINEYHLCGWTSRELRNLGFDVRGSNGLNFPFLWRRGGEVFLAVSLLVDGFLPDQACTLVASHFDRAMEPGERAGDELGSHLGKPS